MKAHLQREGKRSPAKDLRNYWHGMVVDRVMQDWLADPHRRPGAMPAMVDDAMTRGLTEARESGDGVVRWRHAEDRDNLRRFCIELVTRLEAILAGVVLPYTFHAPYRFRVPVVIPRPDGTPTEVNLVGEMDLLVRQPGGWVVYDLKATADDQYWRRVVGQLVFYDLAVLGLYGQRTERTGLIQPMCPEPLLILGVTDDMRRELWARIIGMATDIWTNNITCKEGTSGCTWCDVRHACPRYAPDADTLGLGLRQAVRDAA